MAKNKKSARSLDDRMADVPDLVKMAEELLAFLQNAECVEAESDFDASIADAVETVRTLTLELKALNE